MVDINPNLPDAQQTGERPLNLSDFAVQNQMTEDRVWELIEEGELAARFVNDEILILREQDAPIIAIQEDAPEILPSPPPEPMVEMPERIATAEPAPASIVREPAPTAQKTAGIRREPDMFAMAEAPEEDMEPLPADDYRDLLVFAQDAMNRTMDLSRQLLATKDELLRMKDERIHQLQAELQKSEHELRRLRKKVEDLETLCRLTPEP